MNPKDTELATMVTNAVIIFTNTEEDRELFREFVLRIFEAGIERGMEICKEQYNAKAN